MIPIFVQIQANEREIFFGLCEGSALKTHFQIVHFNYIPPQYAYLPGLLEIFKSKLVYFYYKNIKAKTCFESQSQVKSMN